MIRAAAVIAAALVVACQLAPQPSPTPSPTAAAPRPAPGPDDRPLVLVLIPSNDARVAATAKPIADALQRATGREWQVTVPTSYSTTIEGMCAGETDLAWMAPLAAVTARAKNCADPLVAGLRTDAVAQRASVTYQVQLLARPNTGVAKLADLKGKRIALVQSAAAPASLAVMAQVRKETGADPRTFFSQTIYAPDDAAAVLALYQGHVEAAVTIVDARDAVERTHADVKQRTARVATIGPIPNDGISARRGLPADLRDKVEKALIDHSKTEEGKRALTALYRFDGLEKIDLAPYDQVLEAARVIGIDLDREATATPRPVPPPTK